MAPPPRGSGLVELPALLDEQECAALVALGEQQGFADQVPAPDAPPQYARCEPAGLPAFLVGRLDAALRAAGLAPQQFGPPVLYRFDVGQRLLPSACRQDAGDAILRTRVLVVSLNDDFAGGETVCFLAAGPRQAALRRGDALLFPGYVTSEELPVRRDRKYTLRVSVVLDR
jgi:hypothetical protein